MRYELSKNETWYTLTNGFSENFDLQEQLCMQTHDQWLFVERYLEKSIIRLCGLTDSDLCAGFVV